ncbi:MAG: universal stress protein [Bacteroidota bacterium]
MSKHIPIAAAHFVHILPNYTELEALFEKETQTLIGNYSFEKDRQEELTTEVKAALSKYKDMYVEYQLSRGNPLEEFLKAATATKADLVVVGQRSHTDFHAILAKNLIRKTTCNTLIIPDQARDSLSKILVPIDFSPNSVRALQTAISINRQMKQKVRIIALHIYEVPSVNLLGSSKSYGEYERIIRGNIVDAFQAFLHTYAAEDQNHIDIALKRKQDSDLGKSIHEYALEHKVDLMVAGAKGHSRVHLLLMGSTTEKLVSVNQNIATLIVR